MLFEDLQPAPVLLSPQFRHSHSTPKPQLRASMHEPASREDVRQEVGAII